MPERDPDARRKNANFKWIKPSLEPTQYACSDWATFSAHRWIKSSLEAADHFVSETAITRVEGENCHHYLARSHRETLYYSKLFEVLSSSVRLAIYYLKHQQTPRSIGIILLWVTPF